MKNSFPSCLLIFLFLVFFQFAPSLLKAETPEKKLYLTYYPILQAKNSNYSSSTGKAFIKSLLLPGWGELSAGAGKRAKLFLITEGLLWSGFAALQIYGTWKRNDMEKFAIEKAGVNSSGKDKSYYSDISNFFDIYEYNEEKRRFRQYDQLYPVDDDHFWRWNYQQDQKKFDNLRSSGELAFRNATLVVGGVLINHILSSIDAIWVTHQANKKTTSTVRFSPNLDQQGQLSINVSLSMCW